MPKRKSKLTVVESTVTRSTNSSSSVVINVPKHDTDIDLTMPDGSFISIQFRTESKTMDICLPNKYTVYNWGEHMNPAKIVGKEKHVHLACQLCVDLGDNHE